MGICSRQPRRRDHRRRRSGGIARNPSTIENIKRNWDGARALGLPITMHTSGASPIMALEQSGGLLQADVQFIHPLLTTPEDRAVMKARGSGYSTSPASSKRAGAHSSASFSLANSLRKASRSVSLRPTTLPSSAAIRSLRCAFCSRCTRTASGRACRSR